LYPDGEGRAPLSVEQVVAARSALAADRGYGVQLLRLSMSYRARTAYQNPEQYDRRRSGTPRHRRIRRQEDRFLEEGLVTLARAGDSVLDVATGSGRIAARLIERGLVVSGVEVSQRMLDAARQRLAGMVGHAQLVRADASALPFADGSFDGVTAFRLMGHLPREVRAAALREIARVARHWAIITHIHLWSAEGVGDVVSRALRPLLRPKAMPSPRQPISFREMREELSVAGLTVERIAPCRKYWDEECVVFARPAGWAREASQPGLWEGADSGGATDEPKR
jgi:SAM-dependent methyltransferase